MYCEQIYIISVLLKVCKKGKKKLLIIITLTVMRGQKS